MLSAMHMAQQTLSAKPLNPIPTSNPCTLRHPVNVSGLPYIPIPLEAQGNNHHVITVDIPNQISGGDKDSYK